MRLITIISFILFFSLEGEAIIYTFHTAGDYNDVNNWDVYPGNTLYTNDTISIEADCSGIELDAPIGYVVFSEDVNQVGIFLLTIRLTCQLEFLNDNFWIDITGAFDVSDSYVEYPILTPNNSLINISNFAYGFVTDNCLVWENFVSIDYINEVSGNQNYLLLECMEGTFINDGILEVTSNEFHLNCDLDLSSGTILGSQPYTIPAYNGTIMQNCTGCVATINNLISLTINNNSNFQGQVILNTP
jgi:hypothetical protein